MSDANVIVGKLLEDDHDQHMKAWNRVQKWDQAHASYKEMAGLKKQAYSLFLELGQALAVERALAHLGLSKEDVSHYITGAGASATHNFKRDEPVTLCMNNYCRQYNRPMKQTSVDCHECGQPLTTTQRRVPLSDFRNKYTNYVVGAELRDGRTVMFKEPIPPKTHDYGAESERESRQ